MKECPQCHAQYDDSMNFCTNDGQQLVEKKADVPVSESVPQPVAKKKGGCLKKIVISFIVACVAVVAFYNYIMNAATYLRVEPNQLAASKRGGECKVDVDYDGYVWSINHKPDWVSVVESDNDFVVKVDANQTGQTREGTITLQSGKQLTQVVIQQMGFATQIRASESALKFSSSGGEETLTVLSDGYAWEATCPEWLTLKDVGDGKVRIVCQKNDEAHRTGSIIFKEDNVSTSIFVSQAGKCTNCNGSGEITCSMCYGTGHSGYGIFYSPCIGCAETGRVGCPYCGGDGVVE